MEKLVQINLTTETLRTWLEAKANVLVLDIRKEEDFKEWNIPESYHIDAYDDLRSGITEKLDLIPIPHNAKVVTVCAAGKTSLIAAEYLRSKGVEAYSLDGGMKGWSLSWNKAVIKEEDLTIIQLRRTGKGCLSYILESNQEAIVIDTSLDPKVYLDITKENGWKIKYVLDTHIHADHLSRSLLLAELSEAKLLMPDQDKLTYSFNKIKNGDQLVFGYSELKALHTPGHTLDSTTYIINNKYLFTGDTLFIEGVGRPDLKATEEEAIKRASLLYNSLLKIISRNETSLVLPGHISKPVAFDNQIIAATIFEIKEKVSSIKLSEADFIKSTLSKIPPTPPNYLKVVELNLNGDFKNIDPIEVEAGANRCAIS